MSGSNDHPRPRGILTPADREFLTGGKGDYSKQQKRDRRRKIRERVYHALLDFTLLWMFLEPRDVALIFDTSEDSTNTTLRKTLQDMVAFAVLGMVSIGDNRSLRIGAALLQAATAAGSFPLEYTLRYPDEAYNEHIQWDNTASEAGDTVSSQPTESHPYDSLISKAFPENEWIANRLQEIPSSAKQDEPFGGLSYLIREQVLVGDHGIGLEDIANTLQASMEGPETESVSSLIERLKLERNLMEELPIEREVFAYPMAIDSETNEIIWANELEEYDWYKDHILD